MLNKLSDDQKAEIEAYRAKKWRRSDIAKVTGIPIYLIAEHFESNLKHNAQETRSPDPTPEEIEERCAVYREQQRRNPRSEGGWTLERMPRHYCDLNSLR